MPSERSYTDYHDDAVVQPRKRRLNKIRITKIDVVDRPAQEGARVTLLKRDSGTLGARIAEAVRQGFADAANG